MHRFIAGLADADLFRGTLAHHAVLPRREAAFAEPAAPLPPPLRRALEDLGAARLFVHQARALDAVRRGEHVVLATPTASGKSLAYQVPILEAVLDDPRARALCLYPLKALEQDQRRAADALSSLLSRHAPGCDPRTAIYDGDTTAHMRRKIRESPPNFLISNPDMLHLGILPHHAAWETFFRRLRFIVVDELHAYRGIFGSHIAQVLRRLLRVARYYGAAPQIIACSATIQNPGELAGALTGLPFTVIDGDGAAAAERHLAFVNPEGSPTLAAARIFRHALRAGHRTIAFTRARKITELMHAWTLEEDPDLAGRISAYRSGYLREERREIEGRLKAGDLWGVISTSALELGIDIGQLDVCILVGYPGSIVNTWQRGGRVGRAGRPSAVLLVAQPDALDQYFVRHPEDFLRRTFERAVIDPHNGEILGPHLVCAASELPLRAGDPMLRPAPAAAALEALERSGKLLRSATGREWFAGPRRPHAGVDIRGVGEGFAILDEETGEPIGTVAGERVYAECHEGAVYLHRGRQYRVRRLDLDAREAHARPAEVSYYTRPRGREETEILSVDRTRRVGNFLVRQGRLKVTSWITGYEKRRITGQALLSTHPLALPPSTFETVGVWIDISPDVERVSSREGFHYLGSLHAMEHAAISLFPLFALCDPDDIGGLSYPRHPQLGRSAVFFYDGQAGGVGLCASVFERLEGLLEATRELLLNCPCESGCPSCVQSARCGSGNRPMDKGGAAVVAALLLGHRADPIAVTDEPPAILAGKPPTEVPAREPPPPSGERRVIFLDLETRLSAEEVGGWEKAHLMRLAVAVIYDSREGRFERYGEPEVARLLARLREADLVVGFNVLRFDYAVLGAYADEPLGALPTFDILGDIHRKLGFRLSLGHLAEQTLGIPKSADGLDALRWWREGRTEEVAAYCEQDVEITRRLFEHGVREKHVMFARRDERRVRLAVSWDVEAILRGMGEP